MYELDKPLIDDRLVQRNAAGRDRGFQPLLPRPIASSDIEYPEPLDELDITGRCVGDLVCAARQSGDGRV